MNPQPIGISPISTYPGNPGLVLTVIANTMLFGDLIPFTADSVVQWNGSSRPTTFVDNRHLRALIPASDLASPGVATVTVSTPGVESIPAIFTIAPIAPMIGGVVPYSAPAGSPGFVLMALGTNGTIDQSSGFAGDSVVQWNGSNRATTYVDSRHLLAAILPSDLASAGTANVTVYTPGAGVSSSISHFNITEPATKPPQSLGLSVGGGGAANHSATERTELQTGYATALNSGTVPFGTAVISSRTNGITISETGISPSPPTYRAKIFIDYRAAATVIPGRINSGAVDINTGIAIVNYGSSKAYLNLTLRDLAGDSLATGSGTIDPGSCTAKFVDQLDEIAAGFHLPADFQSTIQFGSLEIQSWQPISVMALRGTLNQRGEFLFTTTPVADLMQPVGSAPAYFPQFADGGGYTTSLVLLNKSDKTQTGSFEFIDDNGGPLSVSQAGGSAGVSFSYSIPPYGGFRFQTDGMPAASKTGWVRLTPDPSTTTPAGAVIFGYNPDTALISESAVPATNGTTSARVYVDLSNNHDTGIALASPTSVPINVSVKAYQTDGITLAGQRQESLTLTGHGHTARFVTELIPILPLNFKGVLEITSNGDPFAALAMRFYKNERNEFLMTSSLIAEASQIAIAPILFPRFATGGGYSTEFIFLSPGGSSTLSLGMFTDAGVQLDTTK